MDLFLDKDAFLQASRELDDKRQELNMVNTQKLFEQLKKIGIQMQEDNFFQGLRMISLTILINT